ncbi:MAG: hypothetical protein PQJ58_09910 [Spirochaetales bacterium]|nr:hypothetical protein [Spirochaetales bacterium]
MEITKYCNIFTLPSETAEIKLQFGLFKQDINKNIKSYIKHHGGLWIGGKFTISDGRFNFSMNSINRTIHPSESDLSFSMSEVKSVWRDFGWISGILNFEFEDKIVKLRCFGAKSVAETISQEYML